MRLDIRLPIGVLFLIVGVMLVAFGAKSDPALYARSLGHNVDVWWGAVLVAFGATFSWFGARAMRQTSRAEKAAEPS